MLSLSLGACNNSDGGKNESETVTDLSNMSGENVEVKASPNKYTWYIKNYVGKNAAAIGYPSARGERSDEYGKGKLRIVFQTPNGEYVDAQNEEDLKGWKVIGQSLAPNTELKYVFRKDSKGKESDVLINTKSIEEVELYVIRKNNYGNDAEELIEPTIEETAIPEENEVVEETEEAANSEINSQENNEEELVDGMRPEFKEAMDAYEKFYDEYCDFLEKYNENPSDMTLITEYGNLLERATEMDEVFGKWSENGMNNEELKYYTEVSNRVMQKLLDAIN